MRDISDKIKTARQARAIATIAVAKETIERVRSNDLPKQDPLLVARVAGIQAAKSTSSIIPYCHPLAIDHASIDYELFDDRIEVFAQVKAIDKTGVEMEALTAASVAALTLYDMLKAIDESMEIREVKLLEKTGGKSDWVFSEKHPRKAAVLVVSDSVSQGTRQDQSGALIAQRLEKYGLKITEFRTVSDDSEQIESSLKEFSDSHHVDLIVTTGGTGLGPRDNTPEVMSLVLDREIPGIAEAARVYGQERIPLAMLSRARAGVRGKTLIVNLPGSTTGVSEFMDALFPGVLHVFHVLSGGGHKASHAKSDHKSDHKAGHGRH